MRASGRHWIALLLAVSALAFSYSGFFFFRDNFSTHYPVKVITAEALRGGEIPWWNFHDSGGQPLAGNPNTLTFYPDNVLLLFLPPHVAFNLHFLLHLAGGFFAMRALCRARGSGRETAAAAAAIYVLSGAVISATAFYNLVTAVALIPLALLGVERRSPRILGAAAGLMLLAAEPVVIGAAVVSVAVAGWRKISVRQLAVAAALAGAIGAPQIIAWSEIAGEVERASTFSARTVLATSLTPLRVAEIFAGPLSGFLNDAGGNRQRLFSTIFIGAAALVALFRKSRYSLLAVLMLAMAVGRYNPLLAVAVEELDSLRIMRFPEKFALPMTVAFCVVIAEMLQVSRWRRIWAAITIAPLAVVAVMSLPVDWFAPYRTEPARARQERVHVRSALRAGQMPAREEYRARARALEPLFGATAGLRYALVRSPDRMHSQLSRLVLDRFTSAPPPVRERYLRIAGAGVPGALPAAAVVPFAVGAASAMHAVQFIERSADFDVTKVAVAPVPFRSAAGSVASVREEGQKILVDVVASGPVLLVVNQSYFRAWVARLGGEELETMPVDADRLGVIVPGSGRVELHFGRYRAATTVAWLASVLLLIGSAFGARIEEPDRSAGEIERAADEH